MSADKKELVAFVLSDKKIIQKRDGSAPKEVNVNMLGRIALSVVRFDEEVAYELLGLKFIRMYIQERIVKAKFRSGDWKVDGAVKFYTVEEAEAHVAHVKTVLAGLKAETEEIKKDQAKTPSLRGLGGRVTYPSVGTRERMISDREQARRNKYMREHPEMETPPWDA